MILVFFLLKTEKKYFGFARGLSGNNHICENGENVAISYTFLHSFNAHMNVTLSIIQMMKRISKIIWPYIEFIYAFIEVFEF